MMNFPPLPIQPTRPLLVEKHIAHKGGALERRPNETAVIFEHVPATQNGQVDWREACDHLGIQLLAVEAKLKDEVAAHDRARSHLRTITEMHRLCVEDVQASRMKLIGMMNKLTNWWGRGLLPGDVKVLLPR